MSDEYPDISELVSVVNRKFLYAHYAAPGPTTWERIAGLRRKGHYVTTAKAPEWLAERDVFVEKWAAIEKEGLAKGFLDYGMCFECAGTVEATTDTEDRVWVFDEEDAK